MRNGKRRILLVAGPDTHTPASLRQLVSGLENAGAAVMVAGDGQSEVKLSAIDAELEKARAGRHPFTLFIDTHGYFEGDGHKLFLEKKSYTPTSTLFAMAADVFYGRPFDIFMTSCHGGMAEAYVQTLPPASNVATMASADSRVYQSDIMRFARYLRRGSGVKDLSAMGLVKKFLMAGPEMKPTPFYGTSGKPGWTDFTAAAEKRLQQGLNPDEFKKVALELGKVMPKAEAGMAVGLMSTGYSQLLTDAHYGRVVAACLAL